jgi:curved DNA-binding protein CbpA
VGGTNEAMIEINKAYAVLRDPDKRAKYDHTGEESAPSIESIFNQLIQQIFTKIVFAVDTTQNDIIKIFLDNINALILDRKSQIKQLESQLSSIESVLDRLTTKANQQIHQVIMNNESELIKQIAVHESQVIDLEACLKFLDDYQYRVDEDLSPTDIGPGMWSHVPWTRSV